MKSPRLIKIRGGGIALCAVALCLSAPLRAQINQTISVTCTSTGQLCTPSYSTVINVPQPGVLNLTYTTPSDPCATWRVHFYADGVQLGTSGFLPPGVMTGPIPDNVTAGNHTIMLQAEGQAGGCDTGTLAAWGGTLSILLPNQQPAVPPTITSLNPGVATPGGPAFTLTVNGSGFLNGAIVQWNGSPLSTTFSDAGSQLTASVPAFLIANPGVANITVLNPNGMASSPSPFVVVLTQTPTVTSVLNAASYNPQICPGSEALISGTNLGTNLAPPPAGTTVAVGGKPAFVASEGGAPTQIIVQIPFEASAGATTLTVAFNGLTSAPYSVMLMKYCPALITFGPNGTGSVNAFEQSRPAPVMPATPAKPGDTIMLLATGLGPTNPPTATGVAGAMNPTATPVSMTIGATAVPAGNILYAGVGGGPPGLDIITLKVPDGVQGTQPLAIAVGGVSSTNPVTLPLAGIDALVSNASFGSAGTAAPGSIATIFANGLGGTDQTTGFPASNFQGVQVTFNGTAAPLFHLVASATPQQIDLLVPDELSTSGNVNVQLSTPTGVNPNYTLNMAPAVPALYRIADPSNPRRFNVIAQFANKAWLALPVSMTAALGFPACTSLLSPLAVCGQPADIGDYLVIYTTGLGITTPNGNSNGAPLKTGAIPPADGSVLYETPTKPTVTIGGIPATLLYSGLAPGFPGEYQVDVQVPAGVANGDEIPVVITMGGLSDTATISIQPRYVTADNN
jgi:uncharacterized protein (TIGR03437 family)